MSFYIHSEQFSMSAYTTDNMEPVRLLIEYGAVLDFRINRKTGGSQAGNNVGQKVGSCVTKFVFTVFQCIIPQVTFDIFLKERDVTFY